MSETAKKKKKSKWVSAFGYRVSFRADEMFKQ